MTTAKMTRKEAAEKIMNSNGKIFTVHFIKRTTGEMREMNCRSGVKKHLKGGNAAYNFSEKMLVPVYDLKNNGYRCIPLEGIQVLKFEQQTFEVTG